jgi:hypothetical protein
MEVQQEVIQGLDCQTAEWHNIFLRVCFQPLEEKKELNPLHFNGEIQPVNFNKTTNLIFLYLN